MSRRKQRPTGDRNETGGGAGGATKAVVIAVLAGGIGLIVAQWLGAFRDADVRDRAATIVEPARLSAVAAQGRVLFEEKCASCHGKNGAGTEQGPPFVNAIYNPGHHPDEAFMQAPRTGVRAHHWKFGDMPPVEDATNAELRAIVRYVRELQEANGITYQPHTM